MIHATTNSKVTTMGILIGKFWVVTLIPANKKSYKGDKEKFMNSSDKHPRQVF